MSVDVHADRPLCGVILTQLGTHLSILHLAEQHAAIMVPAEHRCAVAVGQPRPSGGHPARRRGN